MSQRDVRTVTAPDGRTVAFAEWGDPNGFPVFSLHGSPGSRLGRHHDETLYAREGVRVITYDRPGYGMSDRQPGRATVDCVADVVSIADALGLERFAVTGSSGGGRHALAVAARLPDRVSRVACSNSPAPFDIPGFDWYAGMDAENARLTRLSIEGGPAYIAEAEQLVAGMLERIAGDPANVLGEQFAIPDADRAELARPERHQVLREDIAEAFRNGIWGLVDDDSSLLAPWGFELCEIEVPARVVYGEADVLVPKSHGEWLGRNVPGAEVVVEARGHLASSDKVAERFRWLVRGG